MNFFRSVTFGVAVCLVASTARAEDRSVIFVFGPTGESTGRVAAHAAAATAHQILTSGAAAELWIPGTRDPQTLTKFLGPKDMDASFAYVAGSARAGKVTGFLKDVDLAAFALTRHAGKRLLALVTEGLAASGDAESRLTQAATFCKENAISVIVVDASTGELTPALVALATASGGSVVRDVRTLDASMGGLLPVEQAAEAKKSEPAVRVGIPVFTRLLRTVAPTTQASDSSLGPMHGLFMAEAPLSAFQFQTVGKTYLAHARVMETVRDAGGAVAWQANKDIVIKGPLQKLDARKAGSVCYLRDLKLPGGKYTIEANFEDTDANKKGDSKDSLQARDTVPGLDLSDAIVVRPLNDLVDKYEADQVMSFDGKGLFPVLDPVFPAEVPFDLQVYFVIYPDRQGVKPEMSLEIVRDKQVVGRAALQFGDVFGDSSRTSAAVEQKHQFPYIARIPSAVLSAGQYEARVVVKQKNQSVTRTVPFRVVNGG